MTEHAPLAPSAASRWLQCPASVRMIAEMPHLEEDSSYSIEGTRAHTIAYLLAGKYFGILNDDEYRHGFEAWQDDTPEEQQEEMGQHAEAYVGLLAGLMQNDSTLLLEQKLNTGIDKCWGTGDAIIMSASRIDVVDYKYGQGVFVNAENNPQLKLYGVGALDTFGVISDIDTVGMHIHQPRLDSHTYAEMSADDLRHWRDHTVAPVAEEALTPDAHFGPSASACRFCPVAGECTARMRHVLDEDFGSPDLMTEDELSDALDRVESIKSWCTALEAAALKRAYSDGKKLPRWKVVLSGGRRSVTDYDAAVAALAAAGYDEELVTRKTIETLGYLEKLVGRKELPGILGDALKPGEGKPSLVAEDDPRPEIDATAMAVRDFS